MTAVLEQLTRCETAAKTTEDQLVENLEKTTVLFKEMWKFIVKEVAKGQTAEIHALRARMLNNLERHIEVLKKAGSLNPDVLLPQIDSMEGLKTSVFDRWQTPEDLESLAVRDFRLPADIDRLVSLNRPPQSWYDEDFSNLMTSDEENDKPF